MHLTDSFFMQAAHKQAICAYNQNEVPVGAVIIGPDGAIVSQAYNKVEQTKNPFAHAEMLAIEAAATFIGDWRLQGYSIYVTLEPCALCMQAIIRSRISTLVFATRSLQEGFSLDRYTTFQLYKVPITIREGCGQQQAANLLRNFFQKKRRNGGKQKDIRKN
ncbi:MAG TPA: nucleoside deaminase [Candidatus Babeliales bacterium]|nr:nucleoside deaminase [Candidatus Babeliales bacterium]